MGLHRLDIPQLLKIYNKYNKNVIIVDIYRPIFDICVSNFFNSIYESKAKELDANNENDIAKIINDFNLFFMRNYKHHNVDYYTEVYSPNINVDAFDFEKKCLSYKEENIQYIKIRLCDSDEWANILSPFLIKDFKAVTYNETKDKHTGELYTEFKKQYKIPKNYYELISQNKQFLLYYTKEEQSKYLERFKDKILEDDFIVSKESWVKNKIQENPDLEYHATESAKLQNTNKPIVNNCTCATCMENKEVIINLNDFMDNINISNIIDSISFDILNR
jgi:hypothetical protein